MNRTQSTFIYPQDAMPKKLLITNNFQYKLNQVYSQIGYLNQSSLFDGSKIPGIGGYQQSQLETSKSQGNLHINTQFNQQYNNSSINQSAFYNQQNATNSSQIQYKYSILQTRSTTNQNSLYSSYDFSVKHFGLLCDRTFIENSKAFKSQKYGQRKNIRGIKLDPIDSQQKHNIDLNRHSKLGQEQQQQQKVIIPYSQLSDWDMRMFIKKVLIHNDHRIVLSFNSIEIIAKEKQQQQQQEQEQQNQSETNISDNTVPKNSKLQQQQKSKKKILNHMINFTLLKYLTQYNYNDILTLFQQCMDLSSYQDGEDDNILEIPKLDLDFEQFEEIIKNNKNNNHIEQEQSKSNENNDTVGDDIPDDQSYPEQIEIQCKSNENVIFQVRFPSIELYINDINYKKQITLSKEQILSLINNQYSNLENYLSYIEEDKIKLLKKSTYSTTDLNEVDKKKNNNQTTTQHPNQKTSHKITSMAAFESIQENREVTYLSRISLTQLEERKPLNFNITNSKQERSLQDIMSQKYFKEQVNKEDYLIISFFPSKVSLKQQNVEYAMQITHNLSFQEFYEFISITSQYDLLNFLQSKIQFVVGSQNSDNGDDHEQTLRKKASFLKKIDLQLPKHIFDPKDYVVPNHENEQNGLLKENIGHVTLENKKYLLKISPPFFEINYSLENRREIQYVTIDKLSEIVKRGFNFSYQVIN